MLYDNPFYSRMPQPFGMIKVSDYELPVVRLPEKLFSPGLHGRGIEVYALCAFVAPPGNGKRIPAEFMIRDALAKNLIDSGGTLVEPTSGGMGVAMAYCAKKYHIKVVAIVSDRLPEGKLLPLVRHGATVFKESDMVQKLGLEKSPGSMELARLYAKKTGAVFLDQYHNPSNPASWAKWVAPQIWTLLPHLTAAFFAIGSTGTMRGLGGYLKSRNSLIKVVATMPYLSQDIAGTRDKKRLKEVAPWEYIVDVKDQIDFRVAQSLSASLFRVAGIPAGESSGAAVGMVDHYYLDQFDQGTLAEKNTALVVFLDTYIPYEEIG